MDLYNTFIVISFLIIIPGFFIKKNNYKPIHRLFFFIIGLVLILEMTGYYLKVRTINNSFLYNIGFVYIESLLILLYFTLISQEAKFRKIVRLSMFGLILLGITNTLFFQNITSVFHTYSYSIISLMIIGCCIKFFIDVILQGRYENQNTFGIPHIWIVSGILIFYSSTAIYFSSIHVLYDMNKELFLNLRAVVRFLSATSYLIFAFSFYTPYIFKEKTIATR